jgi:hypothetical protein
VSNPISQAFIDRNIQAKAKAKVTTKLIRNEDMTKAEALQAKKKLKQNSLAPALSTRSNERALRERKTINESPIFLLKKFKRFHKIFLILSNPVWIPTI